MNERSPRILVLRGGAIGDFVLTLPALHALRNRWPGAYIELLGYPHVARLALSGGLVDQVSSLDQAGIARFFALKPMFTAEQTDFIKSFDLIISYLHDPDGSVHSNLELAGAKQVIYGSPLVDTGHAIEHLMKPLESLAIYSSGEAPRLHLDPGARQRGSKTLAEKKLAGALAIHPGSGSATKNWPTERFVAIARKFPGRAFFIIGEAEVAIADKLEREAPGIPVLGNIPLADVAAILAASVLYLGNDSGITHLAAAVGVPVHALFGPSDPARWGPRGEHVIVMRAPGGRFESLTVESVLAAVAGRL